MRDRWQDEAACKGMDAEIFYPNTDGKDADEQATDALEAKLVCFACPVRTECLAAAMSSSPPEAHGVWGGLTEAERRRIIRKQRTIRRAQGLEPPPQKVRVAVRGPGGRFTGSVAMDKPDDD